MAPKEVEREQSKRCSVKKKKLAFCGGLFLARADFVLSGDSKQYM
jgi:hypothetical protein